MADRAKAGANGLADPTITLDRGGIYIKFQNKLLVSGIKKDINLIAGTTGVSCLINLLSFIPSRIIIHIFIKI